ncbi:hypothetical protein [Devosia sp.]|uniref:hypothetical protein n=1 Tax=Devosia sp. TaxID=1871048 RepID=UPI0019E4E116|nr:hypothetical protein [Devosia sp.]MBE0580517.1 hypothetical protein [Devosia sp.]
MKASSIDSVLKDAARSPNWWAVPEAIASWRNLGNVATGMTFWGQASVAAGKPEHALRQMCSAYEFVLTHSPHLPPEFFQLALSRPYTHLELLSRISETDLERAIELIFSPGNVRSVRDLRRVLDEVRAKSDGDISALVEGHKARNHALTTVADQMPSLVAPHSVQAVKYRRWPGTTAAVSPSLVAIHTGTDAAIEVVGVFVFIKPGLDELYRALARVGWESTFFDTYWLVAPSAVISEADALVRKYHLPNVGLVQFDPGGSKLSLARAPTESSPAPDRRSLLHLPERYRR